MNPVTKFESHAELLVKNFVSDYSPWEQLEVKVMFQSTLAKVSDSKIDVCVDVDSPIGTGFLFLNPLAIVQSPKTVFEQAIPHELAHVLTLTQEIIENKTFKEHGEEWHKWLMVFEAPQAALPSIEHEAFDFTANKILKGYTSWGCECGRSFETVFNVTRSLKKYVEGDVNCEYCQSTLQQVNRDSYPKTTRQHLDWLTELDGIRNC